MAELIGETELPRNESAICPICLEQLGPLEAHSDASMHTPSLTGCGEVPDFAQSSVVTLPGCLHRVHGSCLGEYLSHRIIS
eukprot:CAMPEP_0171975878 /NCGR_PEP_ID=MMETSP0993-20121228/239336_1 /TAXON_ID=483369 /ORGANISM="non described non described, Strain CCMP2098" /LENGTH=80 /DNA_ID=CAMNT_0012627249 /DNA_START=45 /DNA_END=284 /DNA_ORIENTATION=+